MEAPCPTSGMTHTGGNGTTGRTGRFEDLIRQDRPQDPKRWALIRGTQTVMGGFTVLCLAAAKQVLLGKGDIQQGVGVVLVSLATLLVGGTVLAHRKPDEQLPGGDQ